MYEVNEFVMYGTIGMCQVKDICTPDFASKGVLYYVLQPVYDASGMIYTKVDSDKVFMRKGITKEEAEEYINRMPVMDSLWFANDKERDSEFKDILKSGDCEKWIQMIKGIYIQKRQKEEVGKKLTQTDTNAFQKAEKLLSGELAVALGIPTDEVHGVIAQKMDV